jgi:CDP-diglyceride synthetase
MLLAVFQLPPYYFSLLIAIVMLFGAYEWLNLTHVTDFKKTPSVFYCTYLHDVVHSMRGRTFLKR